MTRRNAQGFERVTVDDLNDQTTRVVTIEAATVRSFGKGYLASDPAEQRLVLTFKEIEGAEFPLNGTSFHLLEDRYGNDKANGFRGWIGQTCVLVRVETTNPREQGSKVLSVWVARPKEWDQAVREHVSAQRGRGVTPKKARR